jgi:hypothetical protein
MSEQIHTERIDGLHDTRLERGDTYVYQRFTEHSHPELASIARQVHAVGYKGEGFVNDEAVVEDGTLAADIDKARGEHVEYYLGFELSEKGERVPRSTLRKVSIPYGGTIEDLPAYRLSSDHLYPEVLKALRRLPYPHRTLKEISAFAHTPEVSSQAGMEMLRNLLQDGHGSGETWIFTMVESRFKALVRAFGPQMMQQIGDPIPLDDPRVEDVQLVSAMVDADAFLQQIHNSAVTADNPQARRRYMHSLSYLTQGMSVDEMGQDVAAMVNELKKDHELYPKKSGGATTVPNAIGFEALLQLMKKEPSEWRQPDQFDFGSWADRREVRRRIEDGRITAASDSLSSVADELFELRYPERKSAPASRQDFVDTVTREGARLGQWFHFPWNKTIAHYFDQNDHQELRTFRNQNMITKQEQAALLRARIAVIGLSVGSNVVGELLHAGIGGAFILADADTISLTNLNRIKAGMLDVGEKKTFKAGQAISELDPYVEQVHFQNGMSRDVLPELAEARPQIIFDEVDDFPTKVQLREFAQEHGIPLVMATDVGHSSVIDIERYDTESPAMFNGRLDASDIELIKQGNLSPQDKKRITQKLVGIKNASVRLLDSTMDERLAGLPQLGTTASLGGVLSGVVTPDIILGNRATSGRSIVPLRKAMGLQKQSTIAEGIDVLKRMQARLKSR